MSEKTIKCEGCGSKWTFVGVGNQIVARVVVHPKYRTIGASVKLLQESLPLCGKPYVELIAVMV